MCKNFTKSFLILLLIIPFSSVDAALSKSSQLIARFSEKALVNVSGKCLDIDHPELRTNGGKVQIWDCHGGETQQWEFK